MHPVLALFRRNAWATERLVEHTAALPGLDVEAAPPDVYGGIEAQFAHIAGGEEGYLRLVAAESWESALALPERDVELVRPEQRGRDPEVMPDWLPLIQAVHHGDDHRCQVNTLLDRQGFEVPNLDCWQYFAQVGDSGGEPREWWAALLRQFFTYHLWATEKLLDHCAALSPEQLELSAPGTYGALGATLDHLVSSDRSYLAGVVEGGRRPPLNAGGPKRLLEHLAESKMGWLAYLDSGPDFEKPVPRSGGDYPSWVLLMQAIHHGNDHRTHAGEVLLHNGLECPELDVWTYGWESGALRPL